MEAMLKNIEYKKRFAIALVLIYIVFLPIISVITYFILKQIAINNAYNTARLYLTYFEAARDYVGDELRPILLKEMPDRFILQGMSRSYAARAITERVKQKLPGYILRNASLNPMNPKNIANEFEAGIINEFIAKKELREWRGLIEKDGYNYYVLAIGVPLLKGDVCTVTATLRQLQKS
jgi:protein-histidine pros-kinase